MQQLLESFISGDKSDHIVPAALENKKEEIKSSKPIEKKEEPIAVIKKQPEPVFQPEKIKPQKESSTEQHIDKASKLLEEQKKEEKSGFKAEINKFQGRYTAEEEDNLDPYEEDFEAEIREDLPEDHLLDSNENFGSQKHGGS